MSRCIECGRDSDVAHRFWCKTQYAQPSAETARTALFDEAVKCLGRERCEVIPIAYCDPNATKFTGVKTFARHYRKPILGLVGDVIGWTNPAPCSDPECSCHKARR